MTNDVVNETTLTKLINSIQAMKLANSKDTDFINLLDLILVFIGESKQGKSTDSIAKAMDFIEKLRLTPAFLSQKNIPVRSQLIKNKAEVLPLWWEDKSYNQFPPIKHKFYKDLRVIHQILMKQYSPGWVRECQPLSEEKGILTDTLSQWQEDMASLSFGENAHLDTRRGIKIKPSQKVVRFTDHPLEAEEENYFFEQPSFADLVTLLPAYNNEDRNLLLRWLEHNGSQDNEHIISLLFFTGELTFDHSKEDRWQPGGITPIKSEWSDKNGKIIFDCELDVGYLREISGKGQVFWMNTQSSCHDKGTIIKDAETMDKMNDTLKNKRSEILPVMKLKFSLELAIDKNKNPKVVWPKITEFIISANTHFIEFSPQFSAREPSHTPSMVRSFR